MILNLNKDRAMTHYFSRKPLVTFQQDSNTGRKQGPRPIPEGRADRRIQGFRKAGFTLIELLVVISIIALLVGILMPALGAARRSALSIKSVSNLRQVGIGLASYKADRKGFYPIHSSSITKIANVKPRWADYIFPYLNNVEVYRSPNLDEREFVELTKPFWHEVSLTDAEAAVRAGSGVAKPVLPSDPAVHGGYGYNFQYLGNARSSVMFNGRESDLVALSDTVVVGDTTGSAKNGEPGDGGAAAYALDPPLGSARGSGKGSYYEGGGDENTGTYDPGFNYALRSAPAERNNGQAGFVFADGHGTNLSRAEIDDYNQDGFADNGYWNGLGDADSR